MGDNASLTGGWDRRHKTAVQTVRTTRITILVIDMKIWKEFQWFLISHVGLWELICHCTDSTSPRNNDYENRHNIYCGRCKYITSTTSKNRKENTVEAEKTKSTTIASPITRTSASTGTSLTVLIHISHQSRNASQGTKLTHPES